MTKLDAVGEGLTEEQKKEVAKKRAKRAAEKKAAAAAKKVDQPKSAASTEEGVRYFCLRHIWGKMIKVWNHESADKLYCEEIDLGTEKRHIASGLRPFYTLQEMDTSHGMVLCASNDDKSKVEFVRAPEGVPLGERVIFDGYGGSEPEVESKV